MCINKYFNVIAGRGEGLLGSLIYKKRIIFYKLIFQYLNLQSDY